MLRYEISFDDANAADANRYAEELQQILRQVDESVETTSIKPDQNTMDLGTIVGVVVASAAATAVAQGIADWLRKRQDASVTVKENGEVVATNITSEAALDLVRILRNRQ